MDTTLTYALFPALSQRTHKIPKFITEHCHLLYNSVLFTQTEKCFLVLRRSVHITFVDCTELRLTCSRGHTDLISRHLAARTILLKRFLKIENVKPVSKPSRLWFGPYLLWCCSGVSNEHLPLKTRQFFTRQFWLYEEDETRIQKSFWWKTWNEEFIWEVLV